MPFEHFDIALTEPMHETSGTFDVREHKSDDSGR